MPIRSLRVLPALHVPLRFAGRCRRALAATLMLAAGGLAYNAVAMPPLACPQAPGAAIRLTGSAKHGGWVCEATAATTREPLLHVYVGAQPKAPRDLEYHGTTGAPQQPLVWFVAANADPEQRNRKTYYSFLPLKARANTVMMAYFTTCNDADFHRRAGIAARLRP